MFFMNTGVFQVARLVAGAVGSRFFILSNGVVYNRSEKYVVCLQDVFLNCGIEIPFFIVLCCPSEKFLYPFTGAESFQVILTPEKLLALKVL